MRASRITTTILTTFLILTNIEVAAAFSPTPQGYKDSKSAALSAADQLWLKSDAIELSRITKVKVLVNRLTNKVEYVYAPAYGRYVRPKFVMPDAQKLYIKNK